MKKTLGTGRKPAKAAGRRPAKVASRTPGTGAASEVPPTRNQSGVTKTLVVVCNAEHDTAQQINSQGRRQMILLARNLKGFLRNKTICMVNSMALCAQNSAAALAEELANVNIFCRRVLLDDHVTAFGYVHDRLASFDVFIVVTYPAESNKLPSQIAGLREVFVPLQEIQNGQARVVVFGGEELVDIVVLPE
jgi:hypothetical protein